MQFSVFDGSYEQLEADVYIVPLLADGSIGTAGSDVNEDLDGYISELYHNGDITGKTDEVTPLYLTRLKRVIVVGLGAADELTSEGVRGAFAKAMKQAKAMPVQTAVLFVPDGDYAAAVTEGAALAMYAFNAFKTAEEATLVHCTVVGPETEKLHAGVARGEAYAQAIATARDLVNRPPNDLTPEALAAFAQTLAKSFENVSVTVHDERSEERRVGKECRCGWARGRGDEEDRQGR